MLFSPLCPPAEPSPRSRNVPTGIWKSSTSTSRSVAGSKVGSARSDTRAAPLEFMYVVGLSTRTGTLSTAPSVTRARSPRRNGGSPQRATHASASQKPALWRVAAYSGPGLPRPTTARSCSALFAALGLLGLVGLFGLGWRRGAAPAPPAPPALRLGFGRRAALGGLALLLLAFADLADQLGFGDLGGGLGRGGGHLFGPRGHDRGDRELRQGEDRRVRDVQVAYVQRVADLEGGDVELHAIGNVLRQHLDLDLARHLVEHAAGVAHAVRIARQVHRDLQLDLLRGVDLVEVHVDDVGPQGMALDLADQGLHLLAVHRQLDDGALRLDADERLLERFRLDLERLGFAPVPVDHRGDLAVEARLARAALAGGLSGGGRERYDLCHRQSSVLSRQSSVEERAYRLIAVLVPDRLRHQPRDRQDLQLVEVPILGDADRVGDGDLVDRRRPQPLDRRA